MNRRLLFKMFAGSVPLALSGCVAWHDRLRFRLTMGLHVGAALVQASAVRESFYTEDPAWFPSDGASNPHLRGEAVTMALGAGRFVFAMLDGYTSVGGERRRSYGAWTPAELIRGRRRRAAELAGDPRPNVAIPSLKEVKSELARGLLLEPDELPVLVAFDNPATPGSGRVVEPVELTALFSDVRIGRCTVELTSDPVRFGAAAEALPWLAKPARATRADDRANVIATGDFSRH